MDLILKPVTKDVCHISWSIKVDQPAPLSTLTEKRFLVHFMPFVRSEEKKDRSRPVFEKVPQAFLGLTCSYEPFSVKKYRRVTHEDLSLVEMCNLLKHDGGCQKFTLGEAFEVAKKVLEYDQFFPGHGIRVDALVLFEQEGKRGYFLISRNAKKRAHIALKAIDEDFRLLYGTRVFYTKEIH